MHKVAAELEQACAAGAVDTSVDDIARQVSQRLDEVIDELGALRRRWH